METLQELYRKILKQERKKGRKLPEEYDDYPIDCLLDPKKYAPVVSVGNCDDCDGDGGCQDSCIFDALEKIDGKIYIDPMKCTGCGACVDVCKMGHLIENK